ncbi:MAG: ATP-dependent RNA helicase HrpA [Cellulomonas sp.]|uniref:ATP-dependent RNA helicase HrpA n=1 Tax=Cellulomonas sp. TaxID=40001 RepID=UPI0019EF3F11|nr:ATP-dependent RNA helicase HrpA [Cellulomonas sp.]MBF0687994.1 ATP-dependent RNA helicase HrpA [Cellulomonas sp.]
MSTSEPAPADAAPPEGARAEGPRAEVPPTEGPRGPGRRRGPRARRGAGRRGRDQPREGQAAAGQGRDQSSAGQSSGERPSGERPSGDPSPSEGQGRERSSRARAPRHDAARRPRRDDAHLARTAEARAAVTLPPIVYPEQLPVSARRHEISDALRDHQVVVVAGETGSGKTTQIPKIALELGRGRAGQIGHTQPRRIAARTVAERIADELNVPLGGVVGYQVRFTDESSDSTLVKVMTDGILLAQIQRDPMLRMYDTLIIDEAHERSLNIDFILGYLTRLLPQRPDLKLVITSATIDSDRFARHFAGPPTEEHPDGVPAPVVEVSGRTFPVELRYQPLSPDDAPDRDLVTGITEAVDELMGEGPGDILVFLSGEREIRDSEDALRGSLGPRVDPKHPNGVDIVPLYARLSAAEQRRVFEPHTRRRVILATNVAETSLTVPGVRYVVDPGTARISRYSKATKVQRLPIEPISQASANQRSGRSGRVAPGIAIRLYSEEDFESRPEYTEPEILRTSLASVILQMIAVGVVTSPDEVVDFPFVDPPDVRSVRDGVGLLTELHALEEVRGRTRLTETGRQLAQLPIDPRLARMVVEAGRRGVAREVVVIAAALSIQDPRERPAESRETADALHRRFADPSSDLLTYLNLWTYLRDRQRELSGSAFRRMCKSEHLHYLRVREWQDVVTQLREMAKGLGVHAKGAPTPTSDVAPAADGHGRDGRRDGGRHTPTGAPTQDAGTVERPDAVQTRWTWDGDTIHRAMLPGLLSQIGMQLVTDVAAGNPPKGRDGKPRKPDARARNEYLGARGARFAIFPGSGLSRKPPSWVMAAELVETSRLWARDVAKVDPAWVEEAAAHLVKRTYSEPAWSTRQGAAMVNEKVLLYGVPVVAQRRVLLAKTDPEQARELFVRHALVQGEWTTHHTFFHENRRLLDEAEALEARARRRDLVVDDDALFDFYDARIPPEVVSARHFDTWWKVAKRADPDLLSFTRELLVGDDAAEIDEHAFPSRWPQGELSFPLTYQFEPGTEADGVTVHIPLSQLPRVRPEGFDWMVPGMRAELLTATIRALPKPVRVQLVPAPDVARAVDAWLEENSASWVDTVRAADAAPSFREMFARAVRALRDVEVPADAVDEDRLPAHLRMTFRVVGDRGGVVDEGKDLLALQRRLADRAQDAVSSAVRTAVRAAMEQAAAQAGTTPPAPPQPTPAHPPATPPPGARVQSSHAPAPTTPTPGARVQSSHAPGAPAGPGATPDLERTGLTTWPDVPAFPDVIEARTPAGGVVRAYPTLVEEGSGARATVALRVLADAAVAQAAARRGLRRLLLLDVGLASPRVTSRWTGTQALALAASPYPSTDALVADVQLASIDRLMTRHLQGRTPRDIRDADAYATLRGAVRDGLEDDVHRVVGDLVGVLSAWRELDSDVRATSSLALLATAQDVREQAAALVHDGFVSRVGADRLPQLVRYLRAARHRLAKAADNPTRDADLAWQVHDVEQLYTAARERAATASPDPDRDAALDDVRWLLEELRVSLFAQQLGTPVPVSPTRIRKALAAIG